ncbi:MAG: type I 3-dehydroquinate dehydratase [Desulfobacca sp.]|nr:type I 3-dehydroquinate dehydratase [Desulfobacca sp.]
MPVVERTNEGAAQTLEQIAARGYLAELRIDYLSQPDLPSILKPRPGPVIVTNRLPQEGGQWQGSEADRQRLLEKALQLGVEYLDVELRAESRWRDDLLKRRGQTKIILSWHDFQGTPGTAQLQDILDEQIELGADLVKLVTLARTPEDNLRVLALIPPTNAVGQEIIAFCMGPEGKFSRVIAPLLGSYLTFATLAAGRESAPGQLTAAQVEAIWEILT